MDWTEVVLWILTGFFGGFALGWSICWHVRGGDKVREMVALGWKLDKKAWRKNMRNFQDQAFKED